MMEPVMKSNARKMNWLRVINVKNVRNSCKDVRHVQTNKPVQTVLMMMPQTKEVDVLANMV